MLRRARVDPLGRALALNIAALSIFAVACLMTMMTVSTAGMVPQIGGLQQLRQTCR